MRVVRRIVAALLTPIIILLATLLGTVAAVVFTPAGHNLLARIATKWISDAVAGEVQINGVRGNIFNHIELEGVTIRDERGALVVSTPRLQASYSIPGLLTRELVFRNVRADSLVLHLVKLRDGGWNYERVFHLNEGPKGTAPPPHVAFLNLVVTDGSLQIDVPTTPGKPRQRPSRNAKQPEQPRIDTTAEGPVRVYTATDLGASLRLLRVSTPRHDPLLAQISDLHAHLSEPHLSITQLAGQIIAAGDTLRFNFDSLSLPSSHFKGVGAVRWPHDTILFDFALDAPHVAMRDLWWIQPDFPDWSGHGHVIAKAVNGSRTDYRLDNLVLTKADTGIAGNVTVMVDNTHGVGMRNLDMKLHNTPIDVLRPYMDTLPVSGTLTGHLLANGFLDSLRLGGDMVYTDALVAGGPTSHLRIDGVAHFGGVDGAVFQQFRLTQSTLALSTIHHLVPSLLITGTLGLNGQLDGPWKNARFVGTVEHTAPDNAVSRMIGSVRLDTRTLVLGVGLDADFDQLSFDALRSGYPALAARGGLTGHVLANGTLDSLDLVANLTGEIGTFGAEGRVRVNAPHYGADSLVVNMQRIDAEAITGHGTSTSLNGRVVVRGATDAATPPSGSLTIALDRSRIGGATVDAVTGMVRADHGLLMVDTGTVIWNAGRVDAHGTLGWAAPDSGTLALRASVTSLAPFDSLIRAVTGLVPDTVTTRLFAGTAEASLQVTGALDNASVTGTIAGKSLVLDAWHAARLNATLRADSLGKRSIALTLDADTAGKGTHVADKLHVALAGKPDSLHVAGQVEMLGVTAGGGGLWRRADRRSTVELDSLSLAFPRQRWLLASRARMSLADGQLAFRDTLRLRAADGSGTINISGTTPGERPGKLDATIIGLELLDVFGVLQRDTTALDGWGALDLHVAGTRDDPTIKGSVAITGPVIGDVHPPSVLATFDYAAQRLHSDVGLWKTGQRVLGVKVSLPLDLALASRATRKVGGELEITGVADSVDMVILAALVPGIGNPTGSMSLNVKGSGTWNAPVLEGELGIRNGSVSLSSLGVQYTPINAHARFVADSLVIDSMLIGNEDANLRIKGGLRFAHLAAPMMDLDIRAHSFLAIDAPSFLTIRGSGRMQMTGPLLQPILTGDGLTISRSVIYFTDLVTKNVVDLEAPENAALVDTAALRRQGLQNQFSNRFIDSLRIVGLPVHIAADVWLRSAQANIELDGDLTVDKDHKTYFLTGQLNADRGTYTLQVGPISRDFSVDQGTVRYFGTADNNPDLQIQAHHQVRTVDGDDFNVIATITGQILQPKVTLTAPGRDLSARDIVSYILFGRSEFQLAGSQQGTQAYGTFITAALSALSSQLQSTVVSSGFLNLSTLTIRPGATPGALTSGSSVTQIAAGFQFGRRWFVTFDAGLCVGSQSSLQQRNFGASLDYRFNREFRFQAAAEPVQSCISNRAADVFTTLNRYQFGANLLWQKDY